ncbi:MAG: hypothetical protein NTU94_11820 [Planctomycetota bacterium]|nr:hypothetical protein [Planctomycetota bacterium]
MNVIALCVRHAVPVIVGVLLLLLFGVIAMFMIPRQLTPTVEVPVVGVSVVWPGPRRRKWKARSSSGSRSR